MSTKVTKFCSTAFVIGNLAGVFPIAGQPGVYRPHELVDWTTSIVQNPSSHTLSALLFLVGALGGMALGRHTINNGHRWTGTLLMMGAGWNALFIPVPLILAQLTSNGAGIAGLGTNIALSLAIFGDAMFNGLMGLAMILLGSHLKPTSPKLGWSGIFIGALTFFIIGQVEYTACADLLKIAGPLWLSWWIIWGWTVGFSESKAH